MMMLKCHFADDDDCGEDVGDEEYNDDCGDNGDDYGEKGDDDKDYDEDDDHDEDDGDHDDGHDDEDDGDNDDKDLPRELAVKLPAPDPSVVFGSTHLRLKDHLW